jgi:periplasmic protein TonB
MGLLAKPIHGKVFTQRSGVLTAVIGLHLVVLAMAVNSRMKLDPPPATATIEVALLVGENPPQEAPPELPQPRLEQPPDLDTPPILVPVIDIPESRAVAAPPPPPPSPPPAAAPVVATQDEPVMLDVDQVDYIRLPDPRYPRAAKQARLQGTVLVWVLIDTEGRPHQVRVHRSSGHEQFDREGCEAVSRALFKPYRKNGERHSAQVIVPIEFMLTARTAARQP